MQLLELMASNGPLEVLGRLRETGRVKADDADAAPLLEGGLIARRLESYELTETGRQALDVLDVVRASLVPLAKAPDINRPAQELLDHLRRHYP